MPSVDYPQVRAQSIQSMVSVSRLWSHWRAAHPSNALLSSSAFRHLTETHLQICEALTKLLSDSSLDVALSACKIFGDLIAQTSLWIDNEIFPFILSSVDRQSVIKRLVEISRSSVQALTQGLLNSNKVPVSFRPSSTSAL
jgi:hypothetical protein